LKETVKWMETTLVLACCLWLLRRPEQVRLVVWLAVAAGVLEALVGLGQWVAAAEPLSESLRISGTFYQPNPYARYLHLALAPALALAAFSREAWERWVALGASLLLLGAFVLSSSRGGVLGLAVATLTLAVVGVRRERFALLMVATGAPLLALAWLTKLLPAGLLQLMRLNDLAPGGSVTAANFSAWERLAHWAAGVNMLRGHPLLGVGAGNFDAAYARYAPDLTSWPEALGHAHNYYINAAAETGLLGLAAFCAFTALVLFTGWRRAHATQPAGALPRALALGLFAALLALAVHNVTDDLFVHAMSLQVALYVGCLLLHMPLTAPGAAAHAAAARPGGSEGQDGTRNQGGCATLSEQRSGAAGC